ncbi:MAG: hypothetical protein HC777_00565 [Hyphomonadaceae bacterium]|nr:hypothetical protein [Hyphomonadaceae bacterium]
MASALSLVDLRPAGDLVSAWHAIGANTSLNLSGRPQRRLGPLATAQVYAADGRAMIVSPTLQEAHDHHHPL